MKSSNHYTDLAIKSFFKFTEINENDEFLFIDNDGNDIEYLSSYKKIKIIKNKKPLSFSENVNQAIKAAKKNEKNLILYGESLGTGVATHLAQKKNYAGIILETPFTSMIDAAKTFYPYIPVNLLLKDKFENYKKVKNINVPILVMHGEEDQIVPFSMGKKIYEIANEPKFSYFTKYDNHMMEYDEKLVLALQSFLKSLN